MIEQVRKLIADTLEVDVEEVQPGSVLVDDLGADSLSIAELVMAIEKDFDIEIEDEDAERISKVQDVVDYIQEHVRSRE